MFKTIVPYLRITHLYIVITLLLALIIGAKKGENDKKKKIILLILSGSFFIETIAIYLLIKGQPIAFLYSVNAIFHNGLWLLILSMVFRDKETILRWVLLLYLLISALNILFYQGVHVFNHHTFILGSLIYLVFFIWENYSQLRNDNLNFFLSKEYVLILSPVLFFIGASIIFGFNSRMLSETNVFFGMKLYDVIGYFVNFIYYFLITIYFLTGRQFKHDN
jgi:hypothetical protein